MLICEKCGKVIAEEEVKGHIDRDYADVGVGRVCVRESFIADSCECGGEFVEAKQCEKCGEWVVADELDGGWCEKCVKEWEDGH